jgi:hypothetical protein
VAAKRLPDDPLSLIHQLNSRTIRERLDALDRERGALLVLLRAAQRAEREPSVREVERTNRHQAPKT